MNMCTRTIICTLPAILHRSSTEKNSCQFFGCMAVVSEIPLHKQIKG